MSLWAYVHALIISWLAQIEYIDSFLRRTVSAHTPSKMRFASFQQTPSSADHFRCPTPNIHTDQSMWSEALHTKRILGHSFVELRLLNHIGLVSISSSSLDIRWPRHFTFLSCSMMNEVSGTRWFLESMQQQQQQQKKKKKKPLVISHIFTCMYCNSSFFKSLQSQGGRDKKVYLILLFNKHFWSLKHISSFTLMQWVVFSCVCVEWCFYLLISFAVMSFARSLSPWCFFNGRCRGWKSFSQVFKDGCNSGAQTLLSPVLALIKAEYGERDKGRDWRSHTSRIQGVWKFDIVVRLMLKIRILLNPAICHRLFCQDFYLFNFCGSKTICNFFFFQFWIWGRISDGVRSSESKNEIQF